MMIGVAQVMGTKPTFSFFFSSAPFISAANALAAPSGKMVEMAAAAVPAPTARKNIRRLTSVPKMPFITADSTLRARVSSMSEPSGSSSCCSSVCCTVSPLLRMATHSGSRHSGSKQLAGE